MLHFANPSMLQATTGGSVDDITLLPNKPQKAQSYLLLRNNGITVRVDICLKKYADLSIVGILKAIKSLLYLRKQQIRCVTDVLKLQVDLSETACIPSCPTSYKIY